MTPKQEDYIKIIYEMHEKGEAASNKRIAEVLEISPASVTEMLKKLEREQWITIEKNRIFLTGRGEAVAKELLTKHRLWEKFLVEYLGYSWAEVHSDAEVLEHATSFILMERLNQFMKYPTSCPHGNPIYENSNEEQESFPLSEAAETRWIEISSVDDQNELLDYLELKELKIGSIVKLIRRDPFDRTATIQNGDQSIVLGEKVLSMIRCNYADQTPK